MDNLDNPYSKLLYAIYKLRASNVINEEEKRKLKAAAMIGEHNIITILNHYMEDSSAEKFLQEIVKYIRPVRHKPEAIITSKSTGDDVSSPLGTFLHEKKKRQLAEHELKISLQNTGITVIHEHHEEEKTSNSP